ncbi:alpha/beta fold hydrolase [Rivibacter subsaxonicus]|uniref:Pimeloyl-ACP methyl ester carboxylesterase n=1 Tax=Rivibacter subsaxonicus TaxID=457575 RepID=A0A4V2FSG4_9BURK|nr:alpha/beta hydrolase [Rivibacter subsaxonicus]RZT93839.1 pimeloyl-ACP methyl ester carboxylesterase [Rivibacter subsaxonicus]
MQVQAGGTRLEVQIDGPADGEPLLLIMGLGMQLVAWREGLVEQLAARGFRVIRFDNRDIGLSQRFDELGTPNVVWQGLRYALRLPVSAPYTLRDMAADGAALLTALGISSAHVWGASMGGMVAQRLAAEHPQKVRSLTLMMTSSGARHLPQASARVRGALLSRPASGSAEDIVEHYVKLFRLIGSPQYPAPEPELRAFLHGVVQRAGPRSAAGVARQLTAIAGDGDRTPLLARIKVPTSVIHGAADPLVPPANGSQLAQAIGGAQLDMIPGMGHDLPAPLWPRFVDRIHETALRAGAFGAG